MTNPKLISLFTALLFVSTAATAISVTPSQYSIDIEPGEEFNKELVVENDNNEDLFVSLSTKITAENTNPNGLSTGLSTTGFNLDQGEERSVELSLVSDVALAPDTYEVVLEADGEEQDTGGGGSIDISSTEIEEVHRNVTEASHVEEKESTDTPDDGSDTPSDGSTPPSNDTDTGDETAQANASQPSDNPDGAGGSDGSNEPSSVIPNPVDDPAPVLVTAGAVLIAIGIYFLRDAMLRRRRDEPENT